MVMGLMMSMKDRSLKNTCRMKKILTLTVSALTLIACSRTENETAETLSQNVIVRIHDFDGGNNTKATIGYDNQKSFSWTKDDVIGVWPLTVDENQTATQMSFNLSESDGASAVFKGSGWGLICDGKYEYTSYYPYSDNVDKKAIEVNYPANLDLSNDVAISQVFPYLYMYAIPITPENTESASFDFYQLSALAKFVITAPSGVQYTKMTISSAEDIFVTKATYDLTSATKDNKPSIIEKEKVNTIGMSINAVSLKEGTSLTAWFIMCPTALSGKELTIKLYDSNNNKYSGSISCTKDQVSGVVYNYSVTVIKEEKPEFDPASVEPVDLGHTDLLFAPFNVGATSIEEIGDYFANGEVATKAEFTQDNWSGKNATWHENGRKSGNIILKEFDTEFDAAATIWGNGWKTPNYIELNAFLQDSCDKEWVTINGTQGWKCYNKSDHSKWIFLPATGYKDGSKVMNSNFGYYWTSYTTENESGVKTYYNEVCKKDAPSNMGSTQPGYYGLAIRPVIEKSVWEARQKNNQ